MDQKGDIVGEEAAALLKTKKTEFQQASTALAVINNVNAWALDMRLNEKSLHARPRTDGAQHDRAQYPSLSGAYDALEKLNPDEIEKKQIANARKATQDYAKALEAWVAEYKRDAKSAALADFVKTMNRSGDTVSQMVDDYTLTKQAQFSRRSTSPCSSYWRYPRRPSAPGSARRATSSGGTSTSGKSWSSRSSS